QNQQSTLRTSVTGPGSISFWWKVSSQAGSDFLNFYLDNVKQAGISGAVDWQHQTLAVPRGSHALGWMYEKSGLVPSGSDCGWLDQVVYTLDPPVITAQPVSQQLEAGQPLQLSVSADGTPPLRYQWLRNGTNLANRTTSQLAVAATTRRDSGSYAVRVANPAGASVVSRAAVVTILAPQRIAKAFWTTDGSFQLVSSDNQGVPLLPEEQAGFQAQVSTNLIDWTPLTAPTELWYGTLLIFDPDATNYSARFYRVVEHLPR
ncbi:MAG TPA: immunoglobulin domain-containing protein, partial [Verrucomicrobiae bacterium]|nr:immunoglobulin domain-containing protein [Verrucomicrobiae bacterium]